MSDVCHRLRFIDVAKGILIICVVIGHVFNFEYIITAWIKSIICTFHMPAFFIISGILTNKDRVSKETLSIFFLRKIKRLIIPYVLFEIIGGILSMAIFGIENVNLVGIVYGIFTIHCHIGADWFLPTLFFAEILLFINLKYIVKINPLFTAIMSFLTAFLIPDFNYTVAVIRRILIAFGFITAGHICKDAFVKKSMFGLIVSTILLLLITYFNRVVDLSSRSFNNPILYVLGGIVGSYFILDLSQYLFGKLGGGTCCNWKRITNGDGNASTYYVNSKCIIWKCVFSSPTTHTPTHYCGI